METGDRKVRLLRLGPPLRVDSPLSSLIVNRRPGLGAFGPFLKSWISEENGEGTARNAHCFSGCGV